MIPVARILEALEAEWFNGNLLESAQERLGAMLPVHGILLSAEEVAQVRGAVIFAEAKAEGLTKTRAAIVEALALLDGVDELPVTGEEDVDKAPRLDGAFEPQGRQQPNAAPSGSSSAATGLDGADEEEK